MNRDHPYYPLFKMGKYILVNPGGGGAYNVASMENEHVLLTSKYADLFVASPDLLAALRILLLHTKELSLRIGTTSCGAAITMAEDAINKSEGRNTSNIMISETLN